MRRVIDTEVAHLLARASSRVSSGYAHRGAHYCARLTYAHSGSLRRNAFRDALRATAATAGLRCCAIFFLFANLPNYARVFDVYRAAQ
ncbi:hypothetical protein EBT31_20600 [bacterium]|nr:hypothetical protein [bacterium]